MQHTIPKATNIKAENADATQYAADINGKRWSGICYGSRFWVSVQKAIDEGAEVDPFVPYVPTNQDKLQASDMQLVKEAARMIEDMADERVVDGQYVRQEVKDLIAQRKGWRA